MLRGNMITQIHVLNLIERLTDGLRSSVPVPSSEVASLEDEKPQRFLAGVVITDSCDIDSGLSHSKLGFAKGNNIHGQQKVGEQHVELPRLL
jgi:hypothetical protein